MLIGALEALACVVAIELDQDPDYLMTKALLATSVEIQHKALAVVSADLKRNYPWLFELLKNI